MCADFPGRGDLTGVTPSGPLSANVKRTGNTVTVTDITIELFSFMSRLARRAYAYATRLAAHGV